MINFNYFGKQYTLSESNCMAIFNDENSPLNGFDFEQILSSVKPEILDFDTEYFDTPCEKCFKEGDAKQKAYPFLEFHFYAFAKDGNYIMNSLSDAYEPLSFETMERQGKVDAMYIVSVILCSSCGEYTVDISIVD